MDIIKIFFLFFFLIIGGCAKFSYLINQGVGQVYLVSGGTLNKELINDPKIDAKIRSKLKDIEEYKSFFYAYFKKKKTTIYTKTIFLDREAVSYLVTLSPYDRIEAKEECFPFAGCFPYLGFFKQKDAQDYVHLGHNAEFESFIRPVYAYSTLGHFDDRVLSSFFRYNKYDLANLIFHEIFHTIFFIKDEISFNENLASFFAEELTRIYFKNSADYKKTMNEQKVKESIFMSQISKGIKHLNKELEKKEREKQQRLSREEADSLIHNFLHGILAPRMRETCLSSLPDNKCKFDLSKWNSARLAAFGTYNSGQEKIKDLFIKLNVDLKDLLGVIEDKYKKYKKDKKNTKNFESYFFNE